MPVVPYIVLGVVQLLSGVAADWLIARRRLSLSTTRKVRSVVLRPASCAFECTRL
jgi:hypothetical protein